MKTEVIRINSVDYLFVYLPQGTDKDTAKQIKDSITEVGIKCVVLPQIEEPF